MPSGYVALLLHAHLPYIRHPEYESFLEECWLFEAITECYIPLLQTFERLNGDRIRFRITVSLSPPLVAMLRDPFLQERYLAHMSRLLRLADQEVNRTRHDQHFAPLARLYRRTIAETVALFDVHYRRDLVTAFAKLEQAGAIEMITTAATHGYLPLLRQVPSSVRAQVLVGADNHRRAFGKEAPGVWLPECGYYPGLEAVLKEAGYRYFVLDTHGMLNASSRPRRGIHAPLACPNGVAAFGRDPLASKQVWSAEEGYPGDPRYREFYRDVGFDLDFDYIQPYILDGRTRIHTGLKYYRITGKTEHKEPYEPGAARVQTSAHAEHFVSVLRRSLAAGASPGEAPPMVVAPYDAELFGHWWFEGPIWLESLIRQLSKRPDEFELITPSDYLARHPDAQVATPSASSWGDRGYNEFWLNPGNAWIYPQLHRAARRMQEMVAASEQSSEEDLRHRALQQAARSLLLAQASDWAFIMRAGSAVEYAHRRVRDHLSRFHFLEQSARNGDVDERRLRALEAMDNIFPKIDFRAFV
ncbi:MAG: DUF1957 domain-containing protein [Gammaproteobacteria bacterium]|nr:DUF1957 domain-containing protein [Gammaproteobacteria bacterium]